MVIGDYKAPQTKTRPESGNTQPPQYSLAQPVDRLAAVIIDVFMVLMPLLLLACAPFRKQLTSAVLLKDEFLFAMASISIFVVVISVVVLYQGFMVHYFGATVGKLFFGLRVVRLWNGEKPKLWASLLRSLIWFLEILPLAVPHLAVMSNIQRRPLHDRVADTVVISTKEKRTVGSPTMMETSFAKGVFAAFVTFWGLIFFVNITHMYMNYKNQSYLAPIWEEEGNLCQAVGLAQEEWPHEGGELPSRLSVAMALFAAGDLNKSCLHSEVNFAEDQGVYDTLYYLAQSFVNAEDSDLSNRYLDQVCELDNGSDDCLMSQVIEHWAEGDWQAVDKAFKLVRDPSRIYIQLWAIRQYLKNSQFDQAQDIVGDLPNIPAMANFLSQQRAKIYWGLKDYEKAKVAAEVAYDNLNPIGRIDLSSWMCYEQSALGCPEMKSKSCDVFNEEIMQQPTLLSDGKIAMTFVKQHECQERVNYKLLSKAFSNTDFGGFISALESVKDDPADESREILTQLMNSEEVDSSVREESRRRLIGSARNMGELEPFLNEWNKESGGLEWEKTGKALFNRLSQMKKYKESLVVGETLAPFSKNNLPLQKALVKSAVKSGESFTAWKMLKNFKNRQNLRAPASDNDYEKIEKALIKEFGAL